MTEAGLVPAVREVRDGSYLVATPYANEAVVDFGTNIAGADVVLDPGHGGSRDTGAVGANRLVERDLNLAVAEMVRGHLEASGYSVVMTRNANIEVPIVTRAEIALALSPRVFVSIHHNGGPTRRSSDPGTEAFHQAHNPESQQLAGILFEEVHTALSQYDVAWAAISNKGTRAFLRSADGLDRAVSLLRPPRPVQLAEEDTTHRNPSRSSRACPSSPADRPATRPRF